MDPNPNRSIRIILFTLAFLLLGILQTGCIASRIVGKEHTVMREKLLDLHQEQLIDNLIRIKLGMVYMHIDYTDLGAKGNWEITGNASRGDRNFDHDGISLTVDTLDTNDISVGGSGKWNGEMTMKGTPITKNKKLYNAYREFAKCFYGPVSNADVENEILERSKCSSRCKCDLDPNELTIYRTRRWSRNYQSHRGEWNNFFILERDRDKFLDFVNQTTLLEPIPDPKKTELKSTIAQVNQRKTLSTGKTSVSIKIHRNASDGWLVLSLSGADGRITSSSNSILKNTTMDHPILLPENELLTLDIELTTGIDPVKITITSSAGLKKSVELTIPQPATSEKDE